jgi:exodeoxyribonuclease III
MRIVTWNCQMAFDKKAKALFDLKPDVAVVPECPKRASASLLNAAYKSCWFGRNPHKGLAVFWRKEWKIRIIRKPEQKWIVPIAVKAPEPFTLIAVWTTSVKLDYSGQVYQFLKAHPAWFQGPVVVAGDFNSNTRWDEGQGVGEHSDVVRMLEGYGLASAYHVHFNEKQGAESRPTEYFFRHQDKPYHVDYIFVPKPWLPQLREVRVGEYELWSRLSDHCPVIADIQTS